MRKFCAGSNMESGCKFSYDGPCGNEMVYWDLCSKHYLDEDSDAVAPDAPGSDSDDEDGYHSDDPDQRDRYCGICRTTSMKRHYTSSAQVVLPSGKTKQVYFPVCNDCY